MARDLQSSLTDDEAFGREDVLPQPDAGGRSTELFVLAAGSVLLLAGLALILFPSLVPQYAWVVNSLARRGVTSMPLCVGGLMLFGTWLSGRATRAHSAALQEATRSPAPAIQKLGEEVAHLGDGLQGLRIEFVYLKDALHSQQERTQARESSEIPADGMFRLAASLDQVGYRIEERVNTNHLEVGQALQAITTAIENLRSLTPPPRLQIETEARSNAQRRNDPELEAAATVAREISDGWNTDERRSRLGLLDMLDDLGRLLPKKTSPALERPNLPTDSYEDGQDEGWKHSGILPGPLPSARGDESHHYGPGALLGSGRGSGTPDAPLGDKLTELRSLLADERVRDALASIEQKRR